MRLPAFEVTGGQKFSSSSNSSANSSSSEFFILEVFSSKSPSKRRARNLRRHQGRRRYPDLPRFKFVEFIVFAEKGGGRADYGAALRTAAVFGLNGTFTHFNIAIGTNCSHFLPPLSEYFRYSQTPGTILTVWNLSNHEVKKNKKNLRTRKYRRFFGFRGTAIRSDDRRRSRGCRRRNRLRDGDALRAAGLH